MKKIITIILNWNSPSDSICCTKSILAQTTPSDILLVDNASSDNSVKIFQKITQSNSRIRLVKNNKNLGFAGGINSGLKIAIEEQYDYIALLNPDAKAQKDWIKE